MQYNLAIDYDRQKYNTAVEKHLNNRDIVDMGKVHESRTIRQNKYIHVLFNLFAINFGYTSIESKNLLKSKCRLMHYEKKGEIFVKSTSELDVLEMTAFVDWVRNYSSQGGLYLPTPEEYRTNQLYIDEQIRHCNEYL